MLICWQAVRDLSSCDCCTLPSKTSAVSVFMWQYLNRLYLHWLVYERYRWMLFCRELDQKKFKSPKANVSSPPCPHPHNHHLQQVRRPRVHLGQAFSPWTLFTRNNSIKKNDKNIHEHTLESCSVFEICKPKQSRAGFHLCIIYLFI